MDTHATTQGIRVPRLLYGTAWKEDATTRLTTMALEAGFRGIDTANQRRHYDEAAVGDAVKAVLRSGVVKREDLFLQTKFTYRSGQDHRLPYDPAAALSRQVEQSIASSLEHLGVERLDAYLLHGPSFNVGLQDADWETWRAMEDAHRAGQARLLGVSNVAIDQLESIYKGATVKPAIVQNRCFTRPRADEAVRAFCRSNGILYEGFSLLTAITPVLGHPRLREIAERAGRTTPEVVFRYTLQKEMIVLTGTTSREHMDADLQVFGFELGESDVATIDALVTTGRLRP